MMQPRFYCPYVFVGLLVATVICGGCQSSVVKHRHQPPGALDGALDGLYEVTYELPELGGTYTGLIAARTDEEKFRANSRPGVVADAVGGVRGLLATWFGGPAMRGGAFMHWSGTIDPETGSLEGTLLSPVGRMRTEGDLASGTIPVYRASTNEPIGSLTLAPGEPADHPRTDLAAMTNAIQSAFHEALFDPALLESRAVKRFFQRIGRAATASRDDLEFAFAFFIAARDLPFSHVGLGRPSDGDSPSAASASSTSSMKPMVTMVDDGIAVLNLPSFAIPSEWIDESFSELAAHATESLIIDLRRNTGGTYVSLRVANHLLEHETIAGVLFSAAGRADALAGRWERFPGVNAVERIDALHDLLDEHGGVVGIVQPADHHAFAGPVFVLISSQTASASEPLVEVLQRTGRATIIGERTAGAMLSSRRFDLGQGWMLTLPTADYLTADLIRIEGRGVEPDISTSASDALHEALRALQEEDNQSVAESDAADHWRASADEKILDASLEQCMRKTVNRAPVALIDELWNFGDPAASEARFEKAASKQTDEPSRLILETQRARAQGLQRRFEDARATLDEVERLLNEHAEDNRFMVVWPWLLIERGRVHNSSGDRDAARPLFQQALEMLTKSERRDDALAVDAAHMMAIVTTGGESVRWNERSLDTAEISDDPRARRWRASLLNNLGWTYHEAGNFERALEYFERALAARRERNQSRETLIARWAVARCLRSLGRVEEALTHQRELLDAWSELGEQDGYVFEELGECLLLLGQHEDARQHFAAAYNALVQDEWLRANEPQRLERLAGLAGLSPASDEPDRE